MHVLTTLLTLIIGVLYAMSHHASTPTGNQIQQLTTPGGLTVWLTESHQIPMVSFEIAFRAGSGFDPVGKEGLANLTAALMDEGAAELPHHRPANQPGCRAADLILVFPGGDYFRGKKGRMSETHFMASRHGDEAKRAEFV